MTDVASLPIFGLPRKPHNTLVIGLGHRARHGKDQTAAFMVDALRSAGYDARRYGFADALYGYCRTHLGMTSKDAPMLQRVGVEKRAEDPNIWIRQVALKIADDQPVVAIIPDTRFINEGTFVRAWGGALVKVMRFDANGEAFVDPSRPADHPSEVQGESITWDRVVMNNGTMGWLQAQAVTIAHELVTKFVAGLRSF
jgi:hypothetical protein